VAASDIQELPPAYIDEGESAPQLSPVMLTPDLAPPLTPTPVVAKSRTEKATLGVGAVLKQDPREIYSAIASGKEDEYRAESASQINLNDAMAKQQEVIDLANQKTTSLEDLARALHPINTTLALPNDVIEKAFAKNYMSMATTAASYMGGLDDANREIPEHTGRLEEKSSDLIAKLSFAKTMGENLDNEIANQGWAPYLMDQAKTMFQPYNELKMRGLNPDVGRITGGVLLGDNIKAQADALFLRPMAEYKAGLTAIVTELRKDNPTLAREFVSYVEGISENERKLQNVFTIISPLDYAQGFNVSKSLLRKVDVWNRTNKAFKDMVIASKDIGGEIPSKAIIADGAGNNGEAAVVRAGENVSKTLIGNLDPIQDVKEKLTSNFRLDGDILDSNPGKNSAAEMTILKDGFYKAGDRIFDTIMNAIRVNRTPVPLASEDAIRAYKEVARSKYPGLNEALLDIGSPKLEPATNTYHIPFFFGNMGRDLFSSPEVAQGFANHHNLIDARIIQDGAGYKLAVIKPYTETDDIVRSWLINDKAARSTSSAEGFNSWRNSILGWLRGADDTLAYNETLQRKVATYTQSLFRKWAVEESKDIEAVANQFKLTKPSTWYGALVNNKQQFKEFNETLKYAKTMDDENGQRGAFFKTPGDLQDHYMRTYHRLPTFQEQKAYFAYVKMTEGNRILSEIAEFRNRARVGGEQHRISVLARSGVQGSDQYEKSDFFDGIHQKEFPGGEDQILIMGGRLGDERLYNLGRIPSEDLKRYKDQVSKGQQSVIRIYDPDSHPLQKFSDVAGTNRVRYILTDNVESKPLDFNHVNRRGGGHFDVDADLYVKQAHMVEEMAGSVANDKRTRVHTTYIGDDTFMPVAHRAMGKDIVKKMNDMNDFMRDKNYDAAEALSKQMGIEWKTMKEWYQPSRGPGGVIVRPRIDVNEPFHLVPKNKSILDLGKDIQTRHPDFRDGTKTGSDAQQYKVAYNQPRDVNDLYTLKDEGSQGNPIYKYVPADYVDPIPTMNRALNRAIQSTFMDDYKLYAVEHWLSEALPHLKASESEVRSAPFYHFNTASDKGVFVSGTDESTRWNLLSNRFKINQFLGVPSKIDTAIHGLTQLLVDSLYEKLGPLETRGPVGKAAEIIPLWALSKITHPASAIRSFAFNAKLGLFALPQMLVQAQTFTSIWALEPRRGMAGTMAALLHQWSRINSNPEIMKAFDNYATKLNVFGSRWRPGEWLEARQELAKSGFEHVGGEYALADDVMNAKFIKNQWGNFLDAGQIFFREGEKSTRLGAYYTAFREFRDLNPTRAMTDADRAQILNKADLLTTNMSRASSSVLHGGVLSLPTQFLSYQLRLAEMFLGKRIGETTTERTLARARLITAYAAMYGAPSAIGVTGYPFGDSIRQAAINNGYVVGDKFVSSLLMEGIPAMSLAMISGGGDYRKGNFYNVGDRYGSQGFTTLSEAFRSDSTIWKMLGAGPSVIGNTMASMDPFWQRARHMISDDEEGNSYKLTTSDFADLFNEVSSVDAARRWIMAMHTGRWMSKNAAYIADTSAASASFMALTGLKPQAQDDIYTLHNIKNAEEETQKAAEKLIIKDYQRAVQAYSDNDPDLGQSLMTRSRARMISAGIPLDKRAEIYAKASRGYEKMIDSSVQNWATKNVPYGQEDTRMEALSRTYKLRNQ
jgi:hypothetical protein